MIRQIYILLLASFIATLGVSQDVLVPFDLNGCPTDSVRLQVKEQYSLSKFIINSGEKVFWGTSYVTHYKDLDQVTVRGLYADNTEDISMYEIGISLDACDKVLKTASACLDSEVSEVVPIVFDSLVVNFQNVVGFDPNQEYTYAGGESIEYVLGQEGAVINYAVYLDGYPSATQSQSVEAKIVNIESGEYCQGDMIILMSCSGNPNTVFTELSGLAGNNNDVGAEYTFEMRQKDVVIEVYDPDLDWTKEITIRHNLPLKIDLIENIDRTCVGTTINFVEEGSYNFVAYFGEWGGYNGSLEATLYQAYGDYSVPKLVDTIVIGSSFYIETSMDILDYTIEVTKVESNCSDYDITYVDYDPIDEALLSSLPNNLFDRRLVSETIPYEIESWKAYNLVRPIDGLVGYSLSYGVPVLVAEGNNQLIEFENFSEDGLLQITLDVNGECKSYWKSYDTFSDVDYIDIVEQVEPSTDGYCGGDLGVLTSINGNKFIYIGRDSIAIISDSFEYTYRYENSVVFVAQFGSAEERFLGRADKLFDSEGPFCIGQEVNIGLCTDELEVTWDLSELDGVAWPYIIENDVLTFTMPSFEFSLSGDFEIPAFVGSSFITRTISQEIQPVLNGFTPSLIQEEELIICNVLEIESQDEYAETNWYVNGDLVSTENNLTYYLTDFDDLAGDIEVRFEAITSGGCDFFDEVDITYEASINEGELIAVDPITPYCPEEILNLVCPDTFETCRWITKSGSSVSQTYDGAYSEIVEVQAIDAGGCITRQALDYNVIYSDVPLEICQVAGEPLTGSNILFWDTDDDFEMIYIYREENFLGDYQLIDSISGFATLYVDETSESEIRSYRYKIQYRNVCNDLSNLESTPHHKTINLSANIGVNGVVNLAWNDYEGIDYLQVKILRGTAIESMEVIATLPQGIIAYIDASPIVSDIVYYAIEVVLDQSCNDIQSLALISNTVQTQLVSSVNEIEDDLDLILYPNPTAAKLSIRSSNTVINVAIRDINGKVVATYGNQDEYDISDLVSGVYLVMVETDSGQIVRRVYKQNF